MVRPASTRGGIWGLGWCRVWLLLGVVVMLGWEQVGTAALVVPLVQPSPVKFDKTTALAHLYYTELSVCPEAVVQNWTCLWCKPPAVRPSEIHFINNTQQGTRGLVAFVPQTHTVVVAYRGSENLRNWLDNLDFHRTAPHFGAPPSGTLVHTGFQVAYESLRNQTLAAVGALLTSPRCSSPPCHLLVTGHSLGAALATLAAVDLSTLPHFAPPVQLTTFGSPRVGNDAFAAWAMQRVGWEASVRLVNRNDAVPGLPPLSLGFHHVATEVWERRNASSEDVYVVCDKSGEDPSCGPRAADSVDDHVHYLQTNMGYC